MIIKNKVVFKKNLLRPQKQLERYQYNKVVLRKTFFVPNDNSNNNNITKVC